MRICVVSSSRADFGLLKNLILELLKSKIDLKIITTGSHNLKSHGYTIKEIKENNIKVYKNIRLKFTGNDSQNVASSMATCLNSITKILKKLEPDLLIVLGDRYEIYSAAIAAHISGIPIAHIHGGEVTKASIDDAFRHSITKMSHIHFVVNKIYKKNVIQLGENPENVHVVGGLGFDNIKKTDTYSKEYLEKKFHINFLKKIYLISFHPETLNNNLCKEQLNQLLSALRKIKDASLIFTSPGLDFNNKWIIKKIKIFVKNNLSTFYFESLGQRNFFSFLKIADGIIGNSSSGILEVPYFNKWTINLGDRQKGRLQEISIINSPFNKIKILNAIKKVNKIKFKNKIKKYKFLYNESGAILKIKKIIKNQNLKKIFIKNFYNIH
jgi:GDP/UDP-N,N'-diacetylbacillosamine 2-epimerase (hydrolysing)